MPHTPPGSPTVTIAANIRAELARQGKTQTNLAAHLGISQTVVSFRLRGVTEIGVNELVRIAQYLDVPLEALTEGVSDRASA